MSKSPFHWSADLQLARAILHDRRQRRRWLAGSVVVVLLQLGLGIWVIDGWLARDVRLFLLWWLGCAAVAFWLMGFALYDALLVIRETREAERKNDPEA